MLMMLVLVRKPGDDMESGPVLMVLRVATQK